MRCLVRPLPQRRQIHPEAFADAALGIFNLGVYLLGGQIDKTRRNVSQQLLELSRSSSSCRRSVSDDAIHYTELPTGSDRFTASIQLAATCYDRAVILNPYLPLEIPFTILWRYSEPKELTVPKTANETTGEYLSRHPKFYNGSKVTLNVAIYHLSHDPNCANRALWCERP